MDWLLFPAVVVLLVGVLCRIFLADRRAERRRTRDAVSPRLRAELERERHATLERKAKFEEALRTAVNRLKN